jgi:hypothetical protein
MILASVTEQVLVVTVPSVIGSLIAGACAVWAAKIGLANRASLHEVKRKVTTPGKGTLGQKLQAVAEVPRYGKPSPAIAVEADVRARRDGLDAPPQPLADRDLPHG